MCDFQSLVYRQYVDLNVLKPVIIKCMRTVSVRIYYHNQPSKIAKERSENFVQEETSSTQSLSQ